MRPAYYHDLCPRRARVIDYRAEAVAVPRRECLMSGDATPIQPGMDVVIRDVLVPAVDIVRPDESVRVVHRRMEGEALRSLIVVDEGRPVGVIQWRDIMRPNDGEPEQVVSDLMHQAFPVCTENMPESCQPPRT